MKLWLLRHAPVVLAPGLCYGATDVAADAALTGEAARNAAAFLPLGLPVWTSALERTRQLGAALQALRPDLEAPLAEARLNEMNFGQWELQAWSAVPRACFDTWMADFGHHRFGGEESTQMVLDHVGAVVSDLKALGVNEAVWITHAGVIRAVQYLGLHGSDPIGSVEQWPRDAPQPGGYIQMAL